MSNSSSRHAQIADLVTKAQQFLQKGDLAQSELAFQNVLQLDPRNVDALHLLGIIAHRSGKLDAAIELITKAIKIAPSVPNFHLNLGNVLKDQDKLDEAVIYYQKAIHLNPNYAKAYNNLGVSLKDQNKLDQAVTCYEKALSIEANYAEALLNLGTAFQLQEKLDYAANSFLRALQFKPDYALAYFNLGNIFSAQGKPGDAITCFQHALRLDPSHASTYYNLANALSEIGKLDEAIISYREALKLKPDYFDAYSNLGAALRNQADGTAAIDALRHACSLEPKNFKANENLALTLLNEGYLQEGFAIYDRSLDRRLDMDQEELKAIHPPLWDGGDLSGKMLLIRAEQGIGDEIMFASLFPDAIAAAGHCVIECDSRLVPLFARSFPQGEVIPKSRPLHPRATQPDIDLQSSAGSLARYLRPTVGSFPQHRGYLAPDPGRLAFWRQRIAKLGQGIKVGICWRSMLISAERSIHYTKLSQWGPILRAPGIVFVNLQYDDCKAELAAAEQQFGIRIHAFDEIDLKNNLDEAAALTDALDLVISAPTAVAAMAGALGVPTWEIATKAGSWTTLGTDCMPWFPSMRLFLRALKKDNWEGPIEEIARELQRIN